MAEYIEKETAIAWFMPYVHAGESIEAEVVISDLKGMKAADVEPVQEWVDVKDRLPEESGMYIVTANDGHAQRVSFVQWQKKNRMWNLTGARSYWRVTHWMPRPKPPKETYNE